MIEIIWKDVLQYDGLYQVSTEGKVRILRKSGKYEEVPPRFNADGVPVIRLVKTETKPAKQVMVKQIVLPAFCHNPDPKIYNCIICKDNNPANVSLDNLEWSNRSISRQRRQNAGLVTNNKRKLRDLTTGKVYESARQAACVLQVDIHQIHRKAGTGKPINGHILEWISPQGRKLSKKLFNLM